MGATSSIYAMRGKAAAGFGGSSGGGRRLSSVRPARLAALTLARAATPTRFASSRARPNAAAPPTPAKSR